MKRVLRKLFSAFSQVFLPNVCGQKNLGPGFRLETKLSSLPAVVLYRC